MRIITFFLLSLIQVTLFSQILIDEDYSDWNDVSTIFTDTKNDGRYGIDFGRLSVNNDSEYLYLNFDVGKEINLQNDNDITLFIDIDNNINTGYKINGIGADISYFFGERFGYYYRNSKKIKIEHADIGLIPIPTVTSNTFEIALKRKFKAGSYLVNINNEIKIILLQDVQSGDKMPNNNGGFSYKLNDDILEVPAFRIERLNSNDLRILTYNVEKDHYFDNEPPYSRLIKAASPDILCFQEIYNHNSADVRNKIRSYFGGTWYHSKTGSDLIVVSKYPITRTTSIGGNGAFLINKDGKDILIINAHLYCCDKDSKRQIEVDQIMKFIRNSKSGIGDIPLEKNTPIIILGDMNFVGSNNQRKTLIEGDIKDETTYGKDFLPDWDSSIFEDAKPITTGYPATFTWNSDYSSYPKGRLDYVIYSGSVLHKMNSYVLFTRLLDRETLDDFHLNASDSDNASDHFPVVVDFSISNMVSTSEISMDKVEIYNSFPNPVSELFNVEINNSNVSSTVLEISIIDNLGREITKKIIKLYVGKNKFTVNVSNLPDGFYYIRMKSEKTANHKLIKFVVNH